MVIGKIYVVKYFLFVVLYFVSEYVCVLLYGDNLLGGGNVFIFVLVFYKSICCCCYSWYFVNFNEGIEKCEVFNRFGLFWSMVEYVSDLNIVDIINWLILYWI